MFGSMEVSILYDLYTNDCAKLDIHNATYVSVFTRHNSPVMN